MTSWNHLSWGAVAEIAVGVAMLAAAVWLYRRPAADAGNGGERQYGSQGAVLLLAIAAILLIHGLGALEYHPSEAELEAMRGG